MAVRYAVKVDREEIYSSLTPGISVGYVDGFVHGLEYSRVRHPDNPPRVIIEPIEDSET